MPRFKRVKRPDVLAAIRKFDEMDPEEFSDRFRIGPVGKYFILHNHRLYDAKAAIGVAHGKATGDSLEINSLDGQAKPVVNHLRSLGFRVERSGEES